MRQVTIEWLSSSSEEGWINKGNIDVEPLRITTHGSLVVETEEAVCVASSIDATNNVMTGVMLIPKVAIQNMTFTGEAGRG